MNMLCKRRRFAPILPPGSKANTLEVGDNALILVELNGSLAGDDGVGRPSSRKHRE